MIAIELKNGKIETHIKAYIHTDFLFLLNITWNDIRSCGFITWDGMKEEYHQSYIPGTPKQPAF